MTKAYRIVKGRYIRKSGNEKTLFNTGSVFYPTSVELAMLRNMLEEVEGHKPKQAPLKRKRTKATITSEDSQKGAQEAHGKAAYAAEQPAVKANEDEGTEKVLVSEELGGGWYLLTNGERVHGKNQLEVRLKELNNG